GFCKVLLNIYMLYMGVDKIAIPTYEEIMLPLLKILSNGGIHKYKELEEKLKNVFNLTEEVDSRRESGIKIFL
ncbi:MAG: winged helix-turn-helix domain-containing protein, partial [Brevinematia bacterium]